MVFLFSIAAALRLSTRARTEASEQAVPQSFELVYEEHFAFAWRTMRALGVQPGYIDDAVQETFIIIHRRLCDYQPTASMRSWIFGIVRRVAKDYRRSDARRGPQVSMDDRDLAIDTADPYVSATRKQALALVEAFADSLDETRRAIFVLSELEQVSVPEIAVMLEINVNTVYSRLKVIKQSLASFVSRRLGKSQGELYE